MICGVSDKQCRQTWENVRGLPLYLIDGELNGSGPELNARELDRFFKGKEFDVLYCEYRGAGFGGFYDEILRVFSWINSRQRRPARSSPPYPRQLAVLHPVAVNGVEELVSNGVDGAHGGGVGPLAGERPEV